jgi:hypothetical protein
MGPTSGPHVRVKQGAVMGQRGAMGKRREVGRRWGQSAQWPNSFILFFFSIFDFLSLFSFDFFSNSNLDLTLWQICLQTTLHI